jgi:hypothetical protein
MVLPHPCSIGIIPACFIRAIRVIRGSIDSGYAGLSFISGSRLLDDAKRKTGPRGAGLCLFCLISPASQQKAAGRLIGQRPTELLLDGCLDSVLGSRRLNCVLGHHFATAAAIATVATATAVAAVAAVATIATVAAVAAMARVATAILRRAAAIAVATTMLAAVAAAAAIVRATTTATAAGEETGLSRILAANQGDAHEGKKRRHTEHNNAVHPRILQLLTGTVSRNT